MSTDLDRLSQVFINLITNAQKYCQSDAPELTIEVAQDETFALIMFRDNGVPIPATTRALIFEKFARINDQDGSGAGLGLAICREIMTRLGGDVTYVPASLGNCFLVRVPLNVPMPET
jgi:signal transduction histidine kinase